MVSVLRVALLVLLLAFVPYSAAGESLAVFLDHFPSVSHAQAVAVLELAKEMLTAHAHTA